jgi:DNA repair protein RecN (Recombination protein N)
MSPITEDLSTCAVLIEESYRSISQYSDRLHGEPARLHELEERLNQLAKLRQKYGVTLADVIQRRDELEAELIGLSGTEDQLAKELVVREEKANALLRLAEQLSAARKAGGRSFVQSVEAELKDLGMQGARIELKFVDQTSGLVCGHRHIGPKGLEQVELLMCTNEGERLAPLSKIASGGELSRIMLSVKRVMAQQDPVDVYVFDEVDAGVGGHTAEMIGEKLSKVAQIRQAICVTHLAQIAAMGDHHYAVHKQSAEGRTYSTVTKLTGDTRISEVARMLGGRTDSDAARTHAHELLTRQ